MAGSLGALAVGLLWVQMHKCRGQTTTGKAGCLQPPCGLQMEAGRPWGGHLPAQPSLSSGDLAPLASVLCAVVNVYGKNRTTCYLTDPWLVTLNIYLFLEGFPDCSLESELSVLSHLPSFPFRESQSHEENPGVHPWGRGSFRILQNPLTSMCL